VFDPAAGAQIGTWQPYDSSFTGGVFVATAGPENRMVIDAPIAGAIVGPSFDVAGWAFQDSASTGIGIDTIHVWAFPSGGGPPTFLGVPALGVPRPDVAAVFGERYAASGFSLLVNGLSEGTYDLVAFGHNAVSGQFNVRRLVRVTVRWPVDAVRVQIDSPPAGGTVGSRFHIAGWAFDADADAGAGIAAVHAWAYPRAGGGPIFLGAATLGLARPDVAAVFGSQFANAGYGLNVDGLPDGTYEIAVFALADGRTVFSAARTVTVTVVSGHVTLWLAVDLPRPGPQASGGIHVGGWAAVEGGPSRPGIHAIHVWAYPAGGGAPVFLGSAALGGARPDVAAFLGHDDYGSSGFNLLASLPSGTWDVTVFVWPTGAPGWADARVVRIVIP
jgi:hypothetical protein